MSDPGKGLGTAADVLGILGSIKDLLNYGWELERSRSQLKYYVGDEAAQYVETMRIMTYRAFNSESLMDAATYAIEAGLTRDPMEIGGLLQAAWVRSDNVAEALERYQELVDLIVEGDAPSVAKRGFAISEAALVGLDEKELSEALLGQVLADPRTASEAEGWQYQTSLVEQLSAQGLGLLERLTGLVDLRLVQRFLPWHVGASQADGKVALEEFDADLQYVREHHLLDQESLHEIGLRRRMLQADMDRQGMQLRAGLIPVDWLTAGIPGAEEALTRRSEDQWRFDLALVELGASSEMADIRALVHGDLFRTLLGDEIRDEVSQLKAARRLERQSAPESGEDAYLPPSATGLGGERTQDSQAYSGEPVAQVLDRFAEGLEGTDAAGAFLDVFKSGLEAELPSWIQETDEVIGQVLQRVDKGITPEFVRGVIERAAGSGCRGVLTGLDQRGI